MCYYRKYSLKLKEDPKSRTGQKDMKHTGIKLVALKNKLMLHTTNPVTSKIKLNEEFQQSYRKHVFDILEKIYFSAVFIGYTYQVQRQK